MELAQSDDSNNGQGVFQLAIVGTNNIEGNSPTFVMIIRLDQNSA